MASMRVPSPLAEDWVSVQTYGAAGDGATDDAAALQRALNDARRVWVPAGVYRIGETLRIHSGTRLELAPAAVVVLADGFGRDASCFALTNAEPSSADAEIEIRGGTWDGNNRGNRRRSDSPIEPGAYTGVLLHFDCVSDLTFGDATLRDAESYHLRLGRTRRFLVENLRFTSTNPRPNNDGVHLGGGCEDGVVRRLTGVGDHAPSDDLLAINADDAIERVECQGMIRGPIRRITAYDLAAERCHSFLRLLSTGQPIEDVRVERVRGGCTAAAVNMDGARGCRVPVFDEHDPLHAEGVGCGQCIDLADFKVHAASNDLQPLLDVQQRVERLRIRGFSRDHELEPEAASHKPTLRVAHLPGHRVIVERPALDQNKGNGDPASPRFDETLPVRLAVGESWLLDRGGFGRIEISSTSLNPGNP